MIRTLKYLLAPVGLMLVVSCSDPQGCATLEKPQPLESEFALQSRVENAVSVRLTADGVKALDAQFTDIVVGLLATAEVGPIVSVPIEVGEPQSFLGTKIEVCKDGPDMAKQQCIAELDLAKLSFKLAPSKPTSLVAQGTVPLRIKDLPMLVSPPLLPSFTMVAALSGGGDKDCDKNKMSFVNVPIKIEVAIDAERDTKHAARLGYSKASIKNIEIDENVLVSALHFCSQGLAESIVNATKKYISGMIMKQMSAQLLEVANSQLCQPPDPARTPSCPKGSKEKDGICKFDDDACVMRIVGLDAHVDIGNLASTISPGLTAEIDLMAAAGGVSRRTDNNAISYGDLYVVENGLTLGMYAGIEPAPNAKCVTPVKLTPPTKIGQPDEMRGNKIQGWSGEGPHVGAAVAERFANHALASIYNSGALCLAVSTEQVSILSTGLLSLLVSSMPQLTMHRRVAPVKIVLRPQQPPSMQFGTGKDLKTDPHVRLSFNQAASDFYVWSTDRYIRALTVTFDLDVPMNLELSNKEITPILEVINVKSCVVTNSHLLKDDPEAIASSLTSIIQSIAGEYLGDLPPIDMTALLPIDGVSISWQQAGLQRLKQGDDRFLGLFFNIIKTEKSTSLETQGSPSASSFTSVSVVGKSTPKSAYQITKNANTPVPEVLLRLHSSLDDGTQPIEYTYRIGNAPWHGWTSSADIVAKDPVLRMQGIHRITVKSRIKDKPDTQTQSEGTADVTIDMLAPRVELTERGVGLDRQVYMQAWDIVVDEAQLQARYEIDASGFGPWQPVRQMASIKLKETDSRITVQVRDTEGNIGQNSLSLTGQNGVARTTSTDERAANSGCHVATPGVSQTNSSFSWLALLAAGVVWQRTRRSQKPCQRLDSHGKVTTRSATNASVSSLKSTAIKSVGLFAALSLLGCWDDYLGDQTNQLPDSSTPDSTVGDSGIDSVLPCGTPGGPACISLSQGLIGSYTSAALASDGTIWVAGYNEGDWKAGISYGDLVVGKWDGAKVQWEIVDGLPTEPVNDAVYDKNSWRGGQHLAGPDVGRWTSIQVNASGMPLVTYWDITNQTLKLASFDGTTWQVSQIYKAENGEAGRYSKLSLIDDKPVVVFQAIDKGNNSSASSRVVIAKGTVQRPNSPAQWTISDIALHDKTPCRHHLCAPQQKCFADNAQCTVPSSNCSPACGSGTDCKQGACIALIDGTKLDTYPAAIGDYISVAKDATQQLGIVYYDGVDGNLVRLKFDKEDGWVRSILDGQEGVGTNTKDTGNVGVGANVTIDKTGVWHIAYVDKTKNTLNYMRIDTDDKKQIQQVDDGYGVDEGGFADGQHFVGDDAMISVTDSGVIQIAYQDATQGTLRWATRGPTDTTWSRKVIVQDYFGGFFPQQLRKADGVQIVNWWRKGLDEVRGDVRIVTP